MFSIYSKVSVAVVVARVRNTLSVVVCDGAEKERKETKAGITQYVVRV